MTNDEFIGGYSEFAVAKAKLLAAGPQAANLNFLEAASAPVVAPPIRCSLSTRIGSQVKQL